MQGHQRGGGGGMVDGLLGAEVDFRLVSLLGEGDGGGVSMSSMTEAESAEAGMAQAAAA